MAANKQKLLESAQKNLKKNKLSAAIKDYLKVVELDPADIRVRQKLAELLVRSNRSEDAFEHYEVVAKNFSSNGFYLKAIAIYKQMQRIDPSELSLFNRLAELNEKQGLIGNALTEYRNLVSHYEKNDMVADVIKTLEKMSALDETNLNVRVKLAEVYANNDRRDDGLAEFESVLEILTEKEDYDKILKLYKLFLPLFPNSRKIKMGLALTLYEKSEYQKGITILDGLLEEKPDDPDLLRPLVRGYSDLKDWPGVIDACLQLLAQDPTDLDTRNSLYSAQINNGQCQEALAGLEEWKERFLNGDRLEELKLCYESLKEQLPDNRKVLVTLDSIYELTGEGDKLLDIMSSQQTEEEEAEETLSDSILESAVEEDSSDTFELQLDEEDEPVDVPEEDQDLQLESFTGVDSAGSDTGAGEEDSVINLDLKDVDELELSFDLAEEDSNAGVAAEETTDIEGQLQEADFYVQQGLYAEAEKICSDLLTIAPDCEKCQQLLNVVLTKKDQEPEDSVVQNMDINKLLGDEEQDDFLSALDDPDEKKVFRTDVDEQIGSDDMESHYNLGIAYREMGLLEDAISEFEKAEKDPARFVDCQTLKGLCYQDKGDLSSAETMYQQALDSQFLQAEQRLSLSFELGALYESSERLDEALSSYRAVMSQDENFRDVKSRVDTLQNKLGIVDEEPEESNERISFL